MGVPLLLRLTPTSPTIAELGLQEGVCRRIKLEPRRRHHEHRFQPAACLLLPLAT